jgi:chemotaxis protein MotB
MNVEEESSGVPSWVVTYGDLMSLLLTFFILLASMSEIRENDKYQGIADSMHEHFGRISFADAIDFGESRPRNALFASLTLAGKSKRKKLLEDKGHVVAEASSEPRVRVVRPGSRTAVGAVVYFEEGADELDGVAREDLLQAAELLRGKPQIIEVRGHVSQRPSERDRADVWDFAFRRAENTMKFLVDELRIDSKRIRLSVAGPNEPASQSANPQDQSANPRVEVFLLDEVAPEPLPGSRTASSNPPQGSRSN